MALANGQAAQADEAQSISDLTDALKSGWRHLKQPQRHNWRLPNQHQLSQYKASQPANIMPAQPQVTTVQAAEQTPTIIDWLRQATLKLKRISKPNALNQMRLRTKVKSRSTAQMVTGAKMPYTTPGGRKNASVENGATIQQSTDMESTAVEATNQTYVELPKKDAAVTFNVTSSQPML